MPPGGPVPSDTGPPGRYCRTATRESQKVKPLEFDQRGGALTQVELLLAGVVYYLVETDDAGVAELLQNGHLAG